MAGELKPTPAVFDKAALLLEKALPDRKLNETQSFLVSVSGICFNLSQVKSEAAKYVSKHVSDTAAVPHPGISDKGSL